MSSVNNNLSTFEKQKAALEKESFAYKKAMHAALESLEKRTLKTTTLALITGGCLFVAYWLVKKFVFREKKKKHNIAPNPEAPRNKVNIVKPRTKDSFIVKMIKEQIALFLMAVAKEKLKAFLKSQEKS